MFSINNVDAVLLNKVATLAVQAGELIMGVYQREGDIASEAKSDDSPLTEADCLSHRYLHEHLLPLLPDVPLLSEEGGLPDYDTRQQWQSYWLIDPLDGTKEFIRRNGEFTVNIALIVEGKPVLGVVYAPVLKKLYKAINGGTDNDAAYVVDLNEMVKVDGADEMDEGTTISSQSIQVRVEQQQPVRILMSRHHGKENLQVLCEQIEAKFGGVKPVAVGSSLKLCLVAEGEADLYPRLGPTSEWDTAAAQAVVEAAGGSVLDGNLKPLSYNQKACILNPDFYVVGLKPAGKHAVEEKWLSTLKAFAAEYG